MLVAVDNVLFLEDQTLRRLNPFEVYWPLMQEDVHEMVQSYAKCNVHPPLPFATLLQVQIKPRWRKHIVSYLYKRDFHKAMNKKRQKSIKIEANEFFLISD